MSQHDKDWAILLFPLMTLYAIYEIRRGYLVIKEQKYYPTLVGKIKNSLLRSSETEEKVIGEITDNEKLKRSGYYSIITGVFYICLFTFLFFYALKH